MALNIAASIAGNVAERLSQAASSTQAVPPGKCENNPASRAPSGVAANVGNVASGIDRIVADRLAMVNAHVVAAEKRANDPIARRDCYRKGLLFHLFIVGTLLALLWVCYLGLKVMGDDDNEPGQYYPWSITLQLIATVALLHSLVAHYVSTLPCQRHVHWNVIVIGNLVNTVVFAWFVWLIIAITTPNSAGAWPLVLTLFAAAAAFITTAASWFFCPRHRDAHLEPCPEPPA